MTQENKEKKQPAKAKSTPKKRVTRRAARAETPPEVAAVKKAPSKKVESVQNRPRLQEFYHAQVREALIKEFSYKSSMQAPTLDKIVVNIGLGEALTNSRAVESASNDLGLITGQKPIVNRAKKSIANFKLREGMPIGAKVTLRGDMMYEFLDRLISVAIPRVRDFRGLNNKGFDGNGNYTLGVKEQIIFPEISIDKINKVTGMNITIVIDSNTDKESFELLKAFGMPFISAN